MPRSRPNLRLAIACLLAMIATCAGCWQKIEYEGHAPSGSQSAQSQQPAANDRPNENMATAPPNQTNGELTPGAPAPSEPISSPPASVPTASPSKADDDRYAVAPSPSDNSKSPSTPSPAATADTSPPANITAAPPADSAASPPTLPSDSAVTTQPPAKPSVDDRYATHATSDNTAPPPTSSLSLSDAASTRKSAEIESANVAGPVTPSAPTTPDTHPAPPASTSIQPASKAPNSRSAAWILGSRLSLAALANDRQLAAKSVPVWYADAQVAAKLFDISVPNLPQPAPADEASGASKQVMDYLLINGQRIGHDLTKRTGLVESSLFEVALKSNLLLVIYRPGTPTVDTVSAALQEAAVRAKLPEKLWQPLIQSINTQAPPKEVQTAIKKLHSNVEEYLASGALPSGR